MLSNSFFFVFVASFCVRADSGAACRRSVPAERPRASGAQAPRTPREGGGAGPTTPRAPNTPPDCSCARRRNSGSEPGWPRSGQSYPCGTHTNKDKRSSEGEKQKRETASTERPTGRRGWSGREYPGRRSPTTTAAKDTDPITNYNCYYYYYYHY